MVEEAISYTIHVLASILFMEEDESYASHLDVQILRLKEAILEDAYA